MAVQFSVQVECDADLAFECAKKALFSFTPIDFPCFQKSLRTVSARIYFSVPHSEGIITLNKAFLIVISERGGRSAEMAITADYMPGKANSQGTVILTIGEFLKRFEEILTKAQASL